MASTIMSRRQIVRLAGTAAIGVGLVVLLYVALAITRTHAAPLPLVSEPRTSTALVATRPREAGESLGQIRIERLGVAAEIREGESDAVLRTGVGHLADTPWAGEGGNVALAGHRDTVFRALRHITRGDVIVVATGEHTVHYEVEELTVVAPDNLTVLEPSRDSVLTLITCHPFTYIGSAPNRFIVRAREIIKP
jgi:sortase A